MTVTISSQTPFVDANQPRTEGTGTSQQLSTSQLPTIAISGENVRLID